MVDDSFKRQKQVLKRDHFSQYMQSTSWAWRLTSAWIILNDNYDFGSREFSTDDAGCLESVHSRHREIHQHHIG
jgi:hypothetical protein